MIEWLEVAKKQSVTFLNVDKVIQDVSEFERRKNPNKNYIEGALTALIVDHFKNCGVDPKSFSIIAP